jgi:hypothetical protein
MCVIRMTWMKSKVAEEKGTCDMRRRIHAI